ncbi:hypothetical protein BGW36DRAFT_21158 [Talaromyces proteolyticus]|uniref:Uncharacterized protein n=1 Tax=Talaromyces proteolyticus TaxID=1131652 RepID=A0AAD4L2H4_9EURO|nr:uncharacterized protein BGW36DRAFT_21158 [Talaromyces proteolyticus]KAH8706004.1 hypothetical protein BGW36DRAFT_21158 [Talaromyces proteolyticus]
MMLDHPFSMQFMGSRIIMADFTTSRLDIEPSPHIDASDVQASNTESDRCDDPSLLNNTRRLPFLQYLDCSHDTYYSFTNNETVYNDCSGSDKATCGSETNPEDDDQHASVDATESGPNDQDISHTGSNFPDDLPPTAECTRETTIASRNDLEDLKDYMSLGPVCEKRNA